MNRFVTEGLLFSPNEDDSYLFQSSSSDESDCDCSCSDCSSTDSGLVPNLPEDEISEESEVEEPSTTRTESDPEWTPGIKRHAENVYELRAAKKPRVAAAAAPRVPREPICYGKHFRISSETREQLTSMLRGTFANCRRTSPEIAAEMMMWYLGKNESFRQISDRFHATVSSVHEVIKTSMTKVASYLDKYVKFPDEKGQEEISAGLYDATGIKDMVGVVGITHFRIHIYKNGKAHNEGEYMNSEKYLSIALQAVVDHQCRLLAIHTSPGSVPTDEMLVRSGLVVAKDSFGGRRFLAGDAAYPALPWLVPPYRGGAALPPERRLFNEQLEAAGALARDAFRLLGGRFCKLRHLKNEDPEMVERLIKACCVLHNVCLENGEDGDDMMTDTDEGFIASAYGEDDNDHWKRNEVFCSTMDVEHIKDEFLYEEHLPDSCTDLK